MPSPLSLELMRSMLEGDAAVNDIGAPPAMPDAMAGMQPPAPPAVSPQTQLTPLGPSGSDNPDMQRPGVVKGMLGDFVQMFREGLQREIGVPTDTERRNQAFQQNLAMMGEQRRAAQEASEAAQRQALNEDVQTTDADGNVVTIPRRGLSAFQSAVQRARAQKAVAGERTTQVGMQVEGAGERNTAQITSREKIATERNNLFRTLGKAKNDTQLAVAAMRQAKKAAGAGGSSEELQNWVDAAREGLPVNQMPQKVRADVIAAARGQGVNVRFKPMGPAAQKAIDGITEVMPSLDDYVEELQQSGAADKNSLLNKAQSVGEYAAYVGGFKTENSANLQLGNLIGILATQPYTSVGRGKYLFDEVQKHVPKPMDTPAMRLEKAENLQRLLPQLMEHISTSQSTQPQGTGSMRSTTPAAPKGRARIQYK